LSRTFASTVRAKGGASNPTPCKSEHEMTADVWLWRWNTSKRGVIGERESEERECLSIICTRAVWEGRRFPGEIYTSGREEDHYREENAVPQTGSAIDKTAPLIEIVNNNETLRVISGIDGFLLLYDVLRCWKST
jgi:hypothetical protein